ncbi:hypothetical protein KIPB_008788, partial [Kipferlia bialata]|eukprot:g8788.t1
MTLNRAALESCPSYTAPHTDLFTYLRWVMDLSPIEEPPPVSRHK